MAAAVGLATGGNLIAAGSPGKKLEDKRLGLSSSASVGDNSSGLVLRSRSLNNGSSPRGARKLRNELVVRCVSVSQDNPTSTKSELPLKEIPGSYGLPFFGAFRDKLDFYWFEGAGAYYTNRMKKYNSTVYRMNTVPGPPGFPDPRVIILLDAESFPTLFDTSKVEKKDVFTGTYKPDAKYNGGYRILPYLDPSEEKHGILKNFCFEVLKLSGRRVFPEFHTAMTGLFTAWENDLKKEGKVDSNKDLPLATLRFNVKAFLGHDPIAPGEYSIGPDAVSTTKAWQNGQLAPIGVLNTLPKILWPLLELLLHTFPLPFFLFKGKYNKLVDFFRFHGKALLEMGEKQFGLNQDEALHNLVFYTLFNSWGGIDILFPKMLKRLGSTGIEFQSELSAEVTQAVKANGGLNPKALADMPLVKSVVYESLRIDPPVPYQYGRAKKDFIVQSHDASFQVKKGEMVAGFMPIACRDPKVFKEPSAFQPKRFMGEEGSKLLQYVLWSNGRETETPTVDNKQCPGKLFVVTLAQLFVAELFLKYEKIEINETDGVLSSLKVASS